MTVQDIILTIFGGLFMAGLGWLSNIAKSIRALDRNVATILERVDGLGKRVSESETDVKEHRKDIAEIKTNCAMYHHHKRVTDPGE